MNNPKQTAGKMQAPFLVGNHREVWVRGREEWIVRNDSLFYLPLGEIQVGDLLVCDRKRDGTIILRPVTTLLRHLEA